MAFSATLVFAALQMGCEPSWFAAEGVRFAVPGNLCPAAGTTLPAGVTCEEETVPPNTTCDGRTTVDVGTFGNDPRSERAAHHIAHWTVSASAVTSGGVPVTLVSRADIGGVAWTVTVGRNAGGVLFRIDSRTGSFPRRVPDGSGCTGNIYTWELGGVQHSGHIDDMRSILTFRPGTNQRVARVTNTFPVCTANPSDGRITCDATVIQMTTNIADQCWFSITDGDQLGQRATLPNGQPANGSPINLFDLRRIHAIRTCLAL
ncbi:hypothetical protein KBD34_04065 [Patescibacteria group bacterium]|nr:hypothetical protein [Patescibacteria group bacterium]